MGVEYKKFEVSEKIGKIFRCFSACYEVNSIFFSFFFFVGNTFLNFLEHFEREKIMLLFWRNWGGGLLGSFSRTQPPFQTEREILSSIRLGQGFNS